MRPLLVGVLGVLLMAAALAANRPDARQLEQQINQRYHTMRDLHCRIRAHVTLILLPVSVSGDAYFLKPGRVRVVIKDLPQRLGAYQGAFAGAIPRDRSPRDYTTQVTGEENINGRTAWVLQELPQHADNNVQNITTWVDQQSLTVPRMRFQYRDGGTVEGTNEYATVDHLLLPVRTHLQFEVAGFSADADVMYRDYQVNQGVAAAWFQAHP
ncbi:MAG: hypothetical protein ACYCW6_01995 [Candidatus Xenobia bacterium]